MLCKTDLTQKILALIADRCDLTVDEALLQWWIDFRPSGGMRLSDRGYQIFVGVLELESWQFSINASVLIPRNLILLDRRLIFPYYFRTIKRQHWLHMFGDKEAMMATLYGDIDRFLDSLG